MTEDEIDDMLNCRKTYITEDEEKDFRRLTKYLYQMHDRLIEDWGDRDNVGLLAEAAYSIGMALESKMDDFCCRMPDYPDQPDTQVKLK